MSGSISTAPPTAPLVEANQRNGLAESREAAMAAFKAALGLGLGGPRYNG